MIKTTTYLFGRGTKGISFFIKIISLMGIFNLKILLKITIKNFIKVFRSQKTKLLNNKSFKENNYTYLIEEFKKLSKMPKNYAEIFFNTTLSKEYFFKSKLIYSPKVNFSNFK